MQVKEKAWNKWRKNRIDLWNEYKRKTNDYVKVRREEKGILRKILWRSAKAAKIVLKIHKWKIEE